MSDFDQSQGKDQLFSSLDQEMEVPGGNFLGIVGQSELMKRVFHKITVYGPAQAPVIITGETGTGKELIARALHERSERFKMPFVAVNCSALSEELFESELFGHERGSFTGAVKTHKGRFERADKGTLFLDEIGDMPLKTQAKILRVLEEGKFERVGGEQEYPVDVRIIAATNVSLEQAVAVRRFRADLYHRLAVFRIHVPPLRDRPGDIALLVDHFLKILNQRYNRHVLRLTPEALKVLADYHWPGNVRELRNVLERVYVESRGMVIGHNSLNEWVRERDYFAAGEWNLYFPENRKAAKPAIIVPHAPSSNSRQVALLPFKHDTPPRLGDEHWGTPPSTSLPALPFPGNPELQPYELHSHGENARPIDITPTNPSAALTRPLKELNRETVINAIQNTAGNITRAARLLGVHKATLYRHMKNWGLSREVIGIQTQGNRPGGPENP
ncbi:MAG: sigma-54 dependent transcriptional regulator [bacterium]